VKKFSVKKKAHAGFSDRKKIPLPHKKRVVRYCAPDSLVIRLDICLKYRSADPSEDKKRGKWYKKELATATK
jgi:hypothetical protein